MVILTAMCAQMVAFWLSGALQLEHIHPGYALPVIAGPFIAAMTLTSVDYTTAGLAAAGVGAFFWATLGTIIFLRLVHGSPLPTPLVPTMSVLVTPPATAGLAWFAIQNGHPDIVQTGLAGVAILFLCTQLFMLPKYLRGPFHLGYWAFSFPAGALASYSLRWTIAHPSGFTVAVATAALVAATALLLALSIATVSTLRRTRKARQLAASPYNPEGDRG